MKKWEMVRDALDGEDVVKGKNQKYLPIPPGMSPGLNEVIENGKRTTGDRYHFYLQFAEFPEIVAAAVNGFQGIIHEKAPTINLPESMEYLREDATPEGAPLEVLWQAMTREILQTGRIALVCDVNDLNDQIRIAPYVTEALINWRLQAARDGGNPDFVVLNETRTIEDPDDPFRTKDQDVYRELRMVDGNYAVRTWATPVNGGKAEIEEDFVPVLRFGSGLEAVPITVINATDTGFAYGPIPIMPMVRRAFSIYRLTADYRRALYIKGDPQPYITGIDPDDAPTAIGGQAIWAFDSSDVRVGYLDVDGKGIPLTKEALDAEYERFHDEGGKLLSDSDRGAESGEALRRRAASKQVTLKGIVMNAADGLQDVLRKIADLLGADPEAVEFIPDLDFSEPTMTGEELMKLITSKNSGAKLSHRSIHELARRGGLTELSYEEELEEIEDEPEEMPLPESIGFGEDEPDQPEEDEEDEGADE
jgi:hypothetical protein